jgi:hypothetical protein
MRVLVEADQGLREQGSRGAGGGTICKLVDGAPGDKAADQGCNLKAPTA